jgi:hypothetical protein
MSQKDSGLNGKPLYGKAFTVPNIWTSEDPNFK